LGRAWAREETEEGRLGWVCLSLAFPLFGVEEMVRWGGSDDLLLECW
jgi:hypothetical protein